MGVLLDGEWHAEGGISTDEAGAFDRDETTFRDRIEAAEPGRYHLYISRACPWAHGAALVRSLYGLGDAISMDVVDPYRENDGWEFSPEREGCTPDTVNGFDYLRETYVAADPDYTGRVTVPVLWDKQEGTIVNNESIEIMRLLAEVFRGHANDVDLYPEDRREEIDEIVDAIYGPINNGVYRAGFADSQEAYDAAVAELFDALDHWESVLDDRRYLAGERLTLADLRMFPTLVRFDHVYNTHFKCTVRRIEDYPNLRDYRRELYQLPGVERTVNMDHITEHYYRSHGDVNPKRIVAADPDVDFTAPHDRDRLPGGPPAGLAAHSGSAT